ncbi:nuclear transport factor 2 family protein [Planctomycetota bacterium]
MDGTVLIQRAERYIKYSNERRLEAMFRMFRPDSTYQDSQQGTYVGLQRIAAMTRAFFGEFPACSWEVERYDLVTPDTVAFSFEMVGERAGTSCSVARSGTRRLTFDNTGRIVRIEVDLENEIELDSDEQGSGVGAAEDHGADIPVDDDNDADLVAELFDD